MRKMKHPPNAMKSVMMTWQMIRKQTLRTKGEKKNNMKREEMMKTYMMMKNASHQ